MRFRADDPRSVRWSQLHEGIDPTRIPFLRWWLPVVWTLAVPLRRVRPSAITAAGVILAGLAVATAAALPWLGAACVLAAVLCDGLDGAIAVVAERATAAGARADAVADRLCDAAFAAVLWRCGVPWWLALLAGVLAVGVDALRRVRRLASRVTVAERPTFAVCATLACGCAAVSARQWPVLTCAAVWIAACTAALAQLSRAATRRGRGHRAQQPPRRWSGGP